MHELAVSADHLFGRERDLLDRPAISVYGSHSSRFQVDGRRQEPGRSVVWIVDGIHLERLGL